MSFLSRFFKRSKKETPQIDIEEISSTLTKKITPDVTQKATSAVLDEVNKLLKQVSKTIVVHEIRSGNSVQLVKGVTHERFDYVLKSVNQNIPVFLTGPAGCGKNHLCKQVAEALGLEFYFTNAVTQEYRLTGYKDANGVYHDTPFYRAFKYGGLFFLDEIDGSVPEALIIINAAIANRYFDFCGEIVEAHNNFRVIAAGNTYGTGGDLVYTGRYQLDAASLDRFITITMNYSPSIEKAITNNDQELLRFCYAFRKASNRAGINCIFSYRALAYITNLQKEDIPLVDILESSVIKGLSKDDLVTIYTKMRDYMAANNKYLQTISTKMV